MKRLKESTGWQILFVVFAVVIVVVFACLEQIDLLRSDVVSNAVGTCSGVIISLAVVFWQLDQDKKLKAKTAIISLLNLIDEFPSLIQERNLQNCLREKVDESEVNFDLMYEELKSYTHELHQAIEKAETSLVVLTDNSEKLNSFLRTSNIIQINLRELIRVIREAQEIASLNKNDRVKIARNIERKKNLSLEHLQKLVDDLERLTSGGRYLRNINIEEISHEIYKTEYVGKVFNKIEESINELDPQTIKGEARYYYRQSAIEKVTDLSEMMEREELELPEYIKQYHEGDVSEQIKEKAIIDHVLLCVALQRKVELYQDSKGGKIYYSF